MVKHDASALRAQRLKEISVKIAQALADKNVHKVPVQGLNIWIQFNIGLTERKAQEYIDLCVVAHEGWSMTEGYIMNNSGGP